MQAKGEGEEEAAEDAGGCRVGPALRLCIASIHFHPVYSGAGMRFKRYVPGFIERGLDVQVCTGTPERTREAVAGLPHGWTEHPHGAQLPPERHEGMAIHRVRLPDRGGIQREARFAWSVADFCGSESHRPDVVQLISNPPVGIPALWRLRRMGIPTVATQTMMPAPAVGALKSAVRRASVNAASRLVTCLVVGSEVMRAALDASGVRTRVEVIPHGVDTARFRPAVDRTERLRLRRRLGIPDRASVLLFVGAASRRKGIDLLLRTWHRLASGRPDLHLVLAGPRSKGEDAAHGEYEPELGVADTERGVRERLHLLGLVPDTDILMRGADVLIFPSRREGMPNVVLEAMASGLPVVTTPFLGFPREFGNPDRHFILTAFDARRIAGDVGALLDDPGRRAEIARNARARVVAHLALQRSIDRYVDLYEELVQTTRGSRGKRDG